MSLPESTIENLKSLSLFDLKVIAETMMDEYIRLVNVDPQADETKRCRELIRLIHNTINAKVENGEQ